MVANKFTSAEKARIVLESLNTNISTAELCRKYNIHPILSIS
jgi:transposase-like protein